MTRRLVLALLLFAAAGIASAQARRFDMFYLSAPDCPYCARWESQSRAAFLASPEGRAVNFVEVRGETLRQPIEARHYPARYRWAYDQVGPSAGVPRFLLAVDGKVVLSAFGTGGFRNKFLPGLRAAIAKHPLEQP